MHDSSSRRYSLRLKGYDYSQAGAYFVTVCTHRRLLLFGDIAEANVRLNEIGTIVNQSWLNLPKHYAGVELNVFVVMPNHVHGIVILSDEPHTRYGIPEILRGVQNVFCTDS
jgi:putative transposase